MLEVPDRRYDQIDRSTSLHLNGDELHYALAAKINGIALGLRGAVKELCECKRYYTHV